MNIQTEGTLSPLFDKSNEMQKQTHCHQSREYQKQKEKFRIHQRGKDSVFIMQIKPQLID